MSRWCGQLRAPCGCPSTSPPAACSCQSSSCQLPCDGSCVAVCRVVPSRSPHATSLSTSLKHMTIHTLKLYSQLNCTIFNCYSNNYTKESRCILRHITIGMCLLGVENVIHLPVMISKYIYIIYNNIIHLPFFGMVTT